MLHLKIFLKYWIILYIFRISLCVTSPCCVARSYCYEMNNNWRSKLTGRLCLYLVQITTVTKGKLEIGYEQKLHEGRPFLGYPPPPPPPSLPHVTFYDYLTKPSLPLGNGRPFWMTPLMFQGRYLYGAHSISDIKFPWYMSIIS